jgi:N6-L-threonylcarbamoyladenine synthase
LSGIENQCRKMHQNGTPPEDIAAYCIQAVCAALEGMTDAIFEKYGRLPLVYAGGVMSNSYIRARRSMKYGAYFAEPVYSCDNAAGVAYLGWRAMQEGRAR